MSLADLFPEILIGTIWSSSPCMTSVGTSNFLRSSWKSVSENALMLSERFLRPPCYVENSPMDATDPGLCDIVSGGFGQSPGTPGTAAQEAFANQIGADVVYPFSGQGIIGSFS